MDSLVANYASSDEDEEKSDNDSTPSLFSSVPHPKTPPLFSKPEKQQQQEPLKPYAQNFSNTSAIASVESLSLFSSLPPPKSNSDYYVPQQKRVVEFKPPPSLKHQNFDDDDDDSDKEKKKCQEIKPPPSSSSSSVKSFLSNIPAPRNSSTLGVAPTGTGRRSIIETEASHSETLVEPSVAPDYHVSYDSEVFIGNEGSYANYGSYDSEIDPSCVGSYGEYNSEYGSSNWSEVAGAVAVESTFRPRGKRGRNEIPMEIVEVKQDELMKDRPREDQVKLTGIAFGPSYQPVSNKAKPSKLHKRKHQIGTLYFDMKQKEMELQERRAKGFLTKAETQAKYGW